MEKVYVCNKYPFMRVKKLQFVAGELRVTSPEDAQLVESLPWYGVFIHPQDGKDFEYVPVEAAVAEMPAPPKPQRKPAKRKLKKSVRGKSNANNQLHATGG